MFRSSLENFVEQVIATQHFICGKYDPIYSPTELDPDKEIIYISIKFLKNPSIMMSNEGPSYTKSNVIESWLLLHTCGSCCYKTTPNITPLSCHLFVAKVRFINWCISSIHSHLILL
jgi:hypothetical protein